MMTMQTSEIDQHMTPELLLLMLTNWQPVLHGNLTDYLEVMGDVGGSAASEFVLLSALAVAGEVQLSQVTRSYDALLAEYHAIVVTS